MRNLLVAEDIKSERPSLWGLPLSMDSYSLRMMLTTYIVLLRGINVGGKNIIPMKELVKILAESNYQHIKTYIQSGNIVLQSEKEPDNIASLIHAKYGFEP